MYESLLINSPNTYEIISNLANINSFLYTTLKDINWVGFYFYNNSMLYLGPFMGEVACTHIPIEKGVCGKAVRDQTTIIIDDVHNFPDHIACDSKSQSEIVIPIFLENKIFAVLDIDSPIKNRFQNTDKQYLEQVVSAIQKNLNTRVSGFF